jgi:hypothetical protein
LLDKLGAAVWSVACRLLGQRFGKTLQRLLADLRAVEASLFAAPRAVAAVRAT